MGQRKKKDEQPYKVGKPFIKWLDSQIKVGNSLPGCACEKIGDKRENETYEFIRGIVKP